MSSGTKRSRADFDMLSKSKKKEGKRRKEEKISDKTKERVNGQACGQFLGVG